MSIITMSIKDGMIPTLFQKHASRKMNITRRAQYTPITLAEVERDFADVDIWIRKRSVGAALYQTIIIPDGKRYAVSVSRDTDITLRYADTLVQATKQLNAMLARIAGGERM